MNILYFAPIRIYPTGAGNIAKVLGHIKRLRDKGHKVHYLYFEELGLSPFDLFYAQNFVDTLDIVRQDKNIIRPRKDGYYEFDSWYQAGLGEKVAQLCKMYKIDVVICTYVMYSKLLEFVPANILKIIDTHDKMSDRHLSLNENKIKEELFSCIKDDEARYLSRADVVWARRDEETEYFNSIMEKNKAITVTDFDESSSSDANNILQTFDQCFTEEFIRKNLIDNKCSGCGICTKFCPHNAISIEKNSDGFYCVERNENCNRCGLCYKLCAIKNKTLSVSEDLTRINDTVFGNYVNVYSAKSTNADLQYNSSTAGFIRTFLVENLDKFDGVITLCESENPLKPEIRLLHTADEIIKNIAKSKYFSTEASKISEILKNNEGNYIVVGLPCQIASLNRVKKYLKGNFFSIELFCGAVYSQNLMERYFKLKNIEPKTIDFRDKCSGWHNICLSVSTDKQILCKDGTISESLVRTKANDDEFYFAQRNKFCTMEACLKCSYCYNGTADMQVGDFWGEKFKDDEAGVNLVVVRTEKADALINQTANIELQTCSIEDVHNSQPWFVEANKRLENYEKNISQEDIDSLTNKLKINRIMQDYVNSSVKISELRNVYEINKRKLEELPEQQQDKSFVIIPSDCSSMSSFGDQAMLVSLLDKIYSKNPTAKVKLFSFTNNYNYDDLSKYYNYNLEVLSPTEGENISLCERFKIQAAEYNNLIVIGADILDGGCGIQQVIDYYKIMFNALTTGKKVMITGMSFNDKNYPEVIEELINISYAGAIINVRDSVSYSRLKNLGCKNLVQVADMAFLFDETKYKPSTFANNLKQQLEEYKTQGKKIIALHLTSTKEKWEEFLNNFSKAVTDYKDEIFVLFPHDYRCHDQILPDKNMLERTQKSLESIGLNIINAYELKNEIDVKSVIDMCDLLITCRMHIAIAAFSKNVPVISFVYQGKFEGLYNFYNFEQTLMFDKDSFDKEALKNAINYLLNNDLREMIGEKNKKVFESSVKNFEFLR